MRPIRHYNFGNNRILRNYKARTDSRFAALNNVKSLNVAVNIQLIFIVKPWPIMLKFSPIMLLHNAQKVCPLCP